MQETDERIAALLEQGQAAQLRGDASGREQALLAILAFQNDHPAAANALGMIALPHDPGKAERFFLLAAAGDPSSPDLWMNVATARRAKPDDRGERAALDAALAIDQRHLMANVRLAELHERLGEDSAAIYRWGGVATMLAETPGRSEALEQLLAHARTRLAERTGRLGAEIDRALEKARAGGNISDLRRFDACVDTMLGRRRIFHHEPHGLHFPFLPADEFFDVALFPWMAKIEADAPAIRAELEAMLTTPDSGFTPYVAARSGAPESRWTALAGSSAWSAKYLWRYGRRDDAVAERCPRTAAAVERLPLATIPGKGPTAFFSVLQPGARLPAHTGVSNVRAIVHLPLIVPSGCGFRVGGETREWIEGKAFAFDDTIEHEAWNDSDAIRAVLIFDVWNPHLTVVERDMLSELFQLLPSMEDAPASLGAITD